MGELLHVGVILAASKELCVQCSIARNSIQSSKKQNAELAKKVNTKTWLLSALSVFVSNASLNARFPTLNTGEIL